MAIDRVWRACLPCTVVLVCTGLMISPALGQLYSDDPAGGPPSRTTTPALVAPPGLNDMLQPAPAPLSSAPPKPVVDRERSGSPLPTPMSLAERLQAWDDATRGNAEIQIELPRGTPASTVDLARQIESLWNAGQCDLAIAQLQELEAGAAPVALGVGWRTPPLAAADRYATDVRIGARTGGAATGLDYDAAGGKLYALVRWDTDNGWALHGSNDDGASWTELCFWSAGAGQHALDVDLAVVSGYVYVAYVASNYAGEARLRRLIISTGSLDGTYGANVILDAGANTITDVALASNADSGNNRIYYAVRQSDNAVRWAWDISTSGSTFTEASPAGPAAAGGLDLSWNPGFATYYVLVSYVGTDSLVHVLGKATAGWTELTTAPFDGTHTRTSISAWDDHIICAHELQMDHGQGIRYFISHDGGTTWDFYNYIGEPAAGEGPYQMAEVTARGGAGTAIVFTHETGEPDDVLVRYRRNYAPGIWQNAIRVNSNDVSTGTWTTLSWTPRDTNKADELSYGLIYFYGTTPYFDRFQRIPGDCDENALVDQVDFEAFAGCLFGPGVILPFEECFCADLDFDGNVDLADFGRFQSALDQP